jgi:hypothetical protein
MRCIAATRFGNPLRGTGKSLGKGLKQVFPPKLQTSLGLPKISLVARSAVGKRQDTVCNADVSAVEFDSPRDVVVLAALDECSQTLRIASSRKNEPVFIGTCEKMSPFS